MGSERGATMQILKVVIFAGLVFNSLAGAEAQSSSMTYAETCVRGSPPCTSRVAHVALGNESVTDIASLYGVTGAAILGANNLDLREENVTTAEFPKGNLVLIPFACDCINSTRRTNSTVYTIKAGNTLSLIAMDVYQSLVTYQEIAAANGISNPDQIQIGQKVVIPIPCACRNNSYQNETVVFSTVVVPAGGDLSSIAEKFGAVSSDVATVNNIVNASTLMAGDRLVVPLAACTSNFQRTARDYGLVVPNNSYSLSPSAGCVQSSCYGYPTLALHSIPTPARPFSTAKCPSLECSDKVSVGNFTTSSSGVACTVTSCEYEGYANSSAIFTSTMTNSTMQCPVASPAPPEREVTSIAPTLTPGTPFTPGAPGPAPRPSGAVTTFNSQALFMSLGGVVFSISISLYHVFGTL